MTRKITGQCSNCGEAAHPKGNVFHIEDASWFDAMCNHRNFPMPDTDKVKVCNNCGMPHAYHTRTSAKAKRLEATLEWLEAQA